MFPTATVVAAIDNDISAESTLRAARRVLSTEVPSVLHVVHAVDALPSAVERYLFPYGCFGDDRDAVIADILGAGRSALLSNEGISSQVDERFLRVVYGGISDAVLSELSRTGPDMLVVGSGGSSAEPGVIGKNAARLVRRAHVPVLVARGHRRESTSRILVALDLGSDSASLFSDAIRFAHQCGSKVLPFYVSPVLPGVRERSARMDAGMRKDLDRRFQQVLASLKLPYPVQVEATEIVERPRLEEGDAGECIVAAARDQDVDLVILYRCHSSTGSGARLGRVSEYVLRHASCDVLVLPPPVRQESE